MRNGSAVHLYLKRLIHGSCYATHSKSESSASGWRPNSHRAAEAIALASDHRPSDLICPLPPRQVKTREPPRRRCTDELHFVDEYGQPISVQVDGRKGRGHRRRRPHCTNVPAGNHWEALRAMGLMEGEKGRGDGYRAAWVQPSQAAKTLYVKTLMARLLPQALLWSGDHVTPDGTT